MSTTPSGGYVVNVTNFSVDNGNVDVAGRALYAYNGASYESFYSLITDSLANPNEECDIFSSDWEYCYSQKNGSDYVVNKVTEGSQTQATDSVSNLVSSANSVYSYLVEELKNGNEDFEGCDSFKDYYEQIRSTLLEYYGFSEDVVNEGVYYTLSKSGGLYNFTCVVDCAEYIDGVWTKVKLGVIRTFKENMVYRNYFDTLEQMGTSPSSIDDSYRVAIDFSIESYSTKYKPDISEILKREEYNDILNSAVAKMNANNGFVMKQYYTRYLGSSDKTSQLQVYAYDGANYESAYFGHFNTDVVDYKDLSKAQLSEYDGFDYENGSLYYYDKGTYQYKYLASDSRKESVADSQIWNFNYAVNNLSDYVGSSFAETVSNLSSNFNTFFGNASVEKTITFTKNGDIYSLKIVGRGNGSLGFDEAEILLEFTENSITKLIISAENNYPDKDNGKWIYVGYNVEAYNTGSKPSINKDEFTLND